MADNVITIVIKAENLAASGGQKKKEKKEDSPSTKVLKAMLHPVGTLEDAVFKNLGANYQRFYETVKSNVMVFANQSLSRYYSVTEDYIGENYKQNFDKALNTAQNISSSVIQGAMVGGLPGAIIGGTTAVLSTVANERQRINNYYTSLNATNYQTEFNRTRSALVDNNRNTEG